MHNAGRIASIRLRQLREERGLTTSQLAQNIDVSHEDVRAVEPGVSERPRIDERILTALGFTVADLIDDR